MSGTFASQLPRVGRHGIRLSPTALLVGPPARVPMACRRPPRALLGNDRLDSCGWRGVTSTFGDAGRRESEAGCVIERRGAALACQGHRQERAATRPCAVGRHRPGRPVRQRAGSPRPGIAVGRDVGCSRTAIPGDSEPNAVVSMGASLRRPGEPPWRRRTNWKHEDKSHHATRVKSVVQVPEIKVSGCREKPVPLGKFLRRSQSRESTRRHWRLVGTRGRDEAIGLFLAISMR